MLHSVRIVALFWLIAGFKLYAQPVESGDTLEFRKNEHPDKPKFIFELDQRFFYFKDADLPLLRNPINVWGARAGFLLPANVKVGIGYYFTGQQIHESWEGYDVVYRRLQYATTYIEPYFFRRKYWELSLPLEVGLGAARYDVIDIDNQQADSRRTVAVPLSIGLSVSVKFPPLRGLRALRWFGVNLMSGYRYTLQQQVPIGPATLNGVYYSVSPAVFLDRFYEDFSAWRQARRERKR
ncbi:hypothetical protein ACFSUS_07150 [Spirosoma soli]|uniref:DUF3575 domain-containing protein n=1 Tax=Spirosoma soli TaxID=1770529 RepID=A0ABW5M053_9BACT